MVAQIWIMTLYVNSFLNPIEDQTYITSFDDAQIILTKLCLSGVRLPLMKCSGEVRSIQKQKTFRDIKRKSELLSNISNTRRAMSI